MILVIFDVDGTLVDSNQVDEDCYVQALEMEFGLAVGDLDRNWSSYPHATSSGILLEIFHRVWGRLPTDAEKTAFADCFRNLLQNRQQSQPELFMEIRGAGRLIHTLKQSPEFGLGLATGDWRASSEVKLRGAGLPCDGLVFTSADNGISREEIVSQCVDQVLNQCGRTGISKIVSVGDGPWDLKTARNLGLPFLGVGLGLLEHGARYVTQDYSDLDQVMELLRSCEP